ncbi:MAG: chromosomal replication initiator protein DnaA [Candidatus Babeliales bacterium]
MITGTWEEFLTIVREEVGSRVVETWFKAVSLYQWDAAHKVVYLQAPNQFVRDWIQSNYLSLIQFHLGRLLHVDSPKVIVMSNVQEAEQVSATPAQIMMMPAQSYTATDHAVVPATTTHDTLNINSNYTFDTFVVGPSNSLAYAAAHAVTEKPGRLYNPLFLYGGSGLGKTHLLHSIGNEIRTKNPKAVVLYQSTDRFVNEFIHAIRFDKMHKFQAKYKDIDVLLIDDVQFISNKEQTQEAFFHIFNALYESHKQIVFSSDTFPQNIDGLAERLRSRLAWGLVADIHMPLLETKMAIIKKKAEMSNELLCDDVVHYIAARDFMNIRELEGALVRVIACASLTKQPITLELAHKVLGDTYKPAHIIQHGADFERVIKCVRKYYSYDLPELRSKSRNKDISFVRQITMFLMKRVTDKSLRDIGEYLGGRDHSTVMHAIDRIEQQIELRLDFQAHLKRMEQEIVR